MEDNVIWLKAKHSGLKLNSVLIYSPQWLFKPLRFYVFSGMNTEFYGLAPKYHKSIVFVVQDKSCYGEFSLRWPCPGQRYSTWGIWSQSSVSPCSASGVNRVHFNDTCNSIWKGTMSHSAGKKIHYAVYWLKPKQETCHKFKRMSRYGKCSVSFTLHFVEC